MLLIKKLYHLFIYPLIAIYIRKERPFNHKGFHLTVFPGVFHPGFFFSTKFFFRFILPLDLTDKKCLELGCGSGLLSLLMAKNGGVVTSIDVQELAVKNTQVNFQKNKKHLPSDLTVILSDMFDNVPSGYFDFIIINPPYYFADVNYETQKAWFCGKNGEYFHKLFSQLHERINEETNIFMVLAENCDIQRIKEIAEAKGFVLTLSLEKKLWWETNYIFKISSQKHNRKSTFV